MATPTARTAESTSAAKAALEDILAEIAVPQAVLDEAKVRRNLVLEIAMEHDATRARYVSGSVAHGTHNRPLEDTDCGIKVNRRFEAFRVYGPDGDGRGPEEFIQLFAGFVLLRLRQRGYPNAEVNLDGNRAIKLEFNERVEIDDWGPVDPYVDLIVGLARRAGGLWIPNRRRQGWDPAHPQHHTWLMTERDPKRLRVHRAHLLRLAKRAVKRDDVAPGRTKVMHSWNLSALALDVVERTESLGTDLAGFFADASTAIAAGLTDDPFARRGGSDQAARGRDPRRCGHPPERNGGGRRRGARGPQQARRAPRPRRALRARARCHPRARARGHESLPQDPWQHAGCGAAVHGADQADQLRRGVGRGAPLRRRPGGADPFRALRAPTPPALQAHVRRAGAALPLPDRRPDP